MFLAAIFVIIGLAGIGLAFFKVWTASEGQDIRSYTIIAIAGGLAAVAGLVLYIKSSGEIDKQPPTQTPAQMKKNIKTPKIEPTTAEYQLSKNRKKRTPPVVKPGGGEEIPPKGGWNDIFVEDENEEPYTKKDLIEMSHQIHFMLDRFYKNIEEDEARRDEPDYKPSKKWFDLSHDMDLYAKALRRSSLKRRGPGTGKIKQEIMRSTRTMENLVKRYTNAVTFNREIDFQSTQRRLQKVESSLKLLDEQIELLNEDGTMPEDIRRGSRGEPERERRRDRSRGFDPDRPPPQ